MIQFPETALSEWKIVADAAQAEERVRQQIERDTLVDREIERLRIRHEAAIAFQQELDADQTPELEMTTLTNYQNNPLAAPTDLISGVMKSEGLCIMLGPSGSGKSTLALTMLHSLLSGDDWLGQSVDKIDGSVGVVSYDMDAAMILNWMSGFPNIDTNKVSVVNAHKRGNPLAVKTIRSQITTAWKAMQVDVVVIDSFSASFFGHDQNDAAATMAHYRELLAFSRECGAKSLIVITHSTESNPMKARGSTVHHDVADSIVTVATDEKSGLRHVRMAKYRAALGQTQMSPVVVTAPDSVTHLVDLHIGGMTHAGYQLPPSAVAAAFTDLPDPHAAPDTDSDQDEEDDL